jgi:hypothetical protein
MEGQLEATRLIEHYNLDALVAVGYAENQAKGRKQICLRRLGGRAHRVPPFRVFAGRDPRPLWLALDFKCYHNHIVL